MKGSDGEESVEFDFGEGGGGPEEEPEDRARFLASLVALLIERALPDPPCPLTQGQASRCLRVLGKIWNLAEHLPPNFSENPFCGDPEEKLMDMEGYVDEYQYLHIEAVDMGLTNVKILPQQFTWLVSANLSGNCLTNVTACPVTKLPNLVALRLNRNKVEDPYLPAMKYLQYLGLNSNRITSLHRIYHPNLETLDLNYNLVRSVDPADCWKLTKLVQLELRGNRLSTTAGIEYASLVNLYLAQNQITELKGLEVLVNLQRLHLRENLISELSGFSASNVNLRYLNVRRNRIASVEEFKSLSVLKGLRELILKGNGFNPERERRRGGGEEEGEVEEEEEEPGRAEEDEEDDGNEEEDAEMRVQVLTYVPSLVRIDKKKVTKEEVQRMKDNLEEGDSFSK